MHMSAKAEGAEADRKIWSTVSDKLATNVTAAATFISEINSDAFGFIQHVTETCPPSSQQVCCNTLKVVPPENVLSRRGVQKRLSQCIISGPLPQLFLCLPHSLSHRFAQK